jgi:hypothetical protein
MVAISSEFSGAFTKVGLLNYLNPAVNKAKANKVSNYLLDLAQVAVNEEIIFFQTFKR